jgi:hypothetical protein
MEVALPRSGNARGIATSAAADKASIADTHAKAPMSA